MGKKERGWIAAAVAGAAVICFALGGKGAKSVESSRTVDAGKRKTEGKCVVIDAGHGGIDPGKVGINGAKERDINLQVALALKRYLEAADIRVVMTREGDNGLYDEGVSNRKVQDMKRRIALIEETDPDIVVSIHQNSYPEEYVHGAQVFYYTGSTEGQKLAESLQKNLLARTDPENKRGVKANDSYYLLKKTKGTIVIAECGFLSNRREAELLCTELYQQKLAWALHLGILQYLNDLNDLND